MESMKPVEPMMKSMKPMEPMKAMKPMEGVSDRGWWPDSLGAPASSGSQGDRRYAFFPGPRRLVIESEGSVRIYDSAGHRISGVSQQDGRTQSLAFSSDDGLVHVEDLAEVKD